MGGRNSKQKGYRGEILVRDHLRRLGWKADRIPGSGAFANTRTMSQDEREHYAGDVKAERDGRKLTFEVKNKEEFGAIYALYDEHRKAMQDDLLGFVCPGEEKLCLCLSTSLDAVLENPGLVEFQERHPLYGKYKKTFAKLARMQRLLNGADVLVLTMNHKPLMFVRYR